MTGSGLQLLNGFRGRRCLVTGHTGFKGTWLAAWLHHLGAQVTGFALPPDASQGFFTSARVNERVPSIFGDVRSIEQISDAIQRCQPEVVFHLAAQSLVGEGYRDPVATIDTNVMGTVNVLEGVRRENCVQAVVIVTSDKCYEIPPEPRPFTEDDRLGGWDPYSASKAAAELVTAAYRRSFFESANGALIATARAGNVIGAGDGALDRLVPDIVRSLRCGMPVRLRNPGSTRPWQHVLEPLRGYLVLGMRLLRGDASTARAWNFGPSPTSTVTVAELTRRILTAWGAGSVIAAPDREAARELPETQSLELDSTLARQGLGFEPLLSLDEAIALTVEGYRLLEDPAAQAQTLLDRQIDEYMQRLG